MALPNIHIIGIQGSGKGTQSALLVEKYDLTYISSGHAFRKRATVGDEFAKSIQQEMKAGKLLSDSYLRKAVSHFLDEAPISVGLLCDGVIRTLSQQENLKDLWQAHNLDLPFFIHLNLDEETALSRIENRKVEATHPDKKSHHYVYSGKLLQRADDNPAAIHERFALYHHLTEPVIRYYQQLGRTIEIDAADSISNIHQEICNQLEKKYRNFHNVTH